ncbi:MAG: GNAT family N-acetyltransferase [Candidatus Acidiferrales bacterium]
MSAAPQNAPLDIRTPQPDDYARLAELAGELGYPSTAADIARRLDQLAAISPQHAVFFGQRAGEPIAGWICVALQGTIESEPHAEITGFVVGREFRSQRIGEQLLARAEAWAREHGAKTVRLRSNVIRDRAHAFYLREGYEHYKSQKAFRKILTSGKT